MTRPLVIGIGNPYRHDDGLGPALIERLRLAGEDRLEIVEETGEPAALVQRWSGRGCVLLVDAVDSGGLPGGLHRFDCQRGSWRAGPPPAVLSTHGSGIVEAVELGRALDRLPDQLVFFGIEVEDTSDGVGLSPKVSVALDSLVRELPGIASALATPATRATPLPCQEAQS